jgi:hypothetical protein
MKDDLVKFIKKDLTKLSYQFTEGAENINMLASSLEEACHLPLLSRPTAINWNNRACYRRGIFRG